MLCGASFALCDSHMPCLLSTGNDKTDKARENATEAAQCAFKTAVADVGILTCHGNVGNDRRNRGCGWMGKVDYDLKCCRHIM